MSPHGQRSSRRQEGESFIAPDVQLQKITDWAKHEVEIVQWWEEIDAPGAKLQRPMFPEALPRCEAGERSGIVVAPPRSRRPLGGDRSRLV